MKRATEPLLRGFELYEAKLLQRAEKIEPGVIRRVLDEAVAAMIEPTRQYLRANLEAIVYP